MADVLDINTAVEFDDDGEKGIARLKNKVKRRKGRGFQNEQSIRNKIQYEELIDANENEFGPKKSVEGWILFVTSVHEEACEEDLHDKFAEFGTIKSINMNLDRRTGFLKGYALIEYEYFEEANGAKESLDGCELLGQPIEVNWCFVKGNKKNKKKIGSTYYRNKDTKMLH